MPPVLHLPTRKAASAAVELEQVVRPADQVPLALRRQKFPAVKRINPATTLDLPEYRLDGFRPRVVLISRTTPRLVRIELDPVSFVTLRGPSGAVVYRAGGTEPLGKVPHTIEINGDALFEVRKEGCYASNIAVAPGSPSEIDVILEEIPYKTIVTTPSGAEIYRLGGIEKLGESPYTTIVDGERIFEIKKKGFQTSVIGMGADSPARLNVPLTAAQRDDPDAAALGELDSPVIGTY